MSSIISLSRGRAECPPYWTSKYTHPRLLYEHLAVSLFLLCLPGFPPATQASCHSPSAKSALIGCCRLAVGVKVSVIGRWPICVGRQFIKAPCSLLRQLEWTLALTQLHRAGVYFPSGTKWIEGEREREMDGRILLLPWVLSEWQPCIPGSVFLPQSSVGSQLERFTNFPETCLTFCQIWSCKPARRADLLLFCLTVHSTAGEWHIQTLVC